MQHYAAFHLGNHCLPKYPFRRFQYIKGSIMRICCILYLSSLNIGDFSFKTLLKIQILSLDRSVLSVNVLKKKKKGLNYSLISTLDP